jgi:hypothetical protein
MSKIAILLALTVSVPAAAGESKSFYTMGLGYVSCAEFAQTYAKDVNAENIYYLWAQGYMSAKNMDTMVYAALGAKIAPGVPLPPPNNLKAVDKDSQLARIRIFCDANPLKYYAEAIDSLYLSLPPIKDGH